MSEEIIAKIKQEQSIVENAITVPNLDIEFYRDFLENADFSDPCNYEYIDVAQFIMAYVKSVDSSYSLDKLKPLATNLSYIIKNNPAEALKNLLETVVFLADEEMYPDFLKVIGDDNEIKRSFSLYKIVEQNPMASFLENGLELLSSCHGRLFNLVTEFYESPEAWQFGLSVVYAFKEITERKYFLEDEYRRLKRSYTFDDFAIKKGIQGILVKEFQVESIEKTCKKITKYYHCLLQKEEKKKRALHQASSNYQKLSEDIKQAEKEKEITNYRALISKCANTNLRCDVLSWVYHHNEKYYDELESKYQVLSENNPRNYQRLLQQHHMEHEVSLEEVMRSYSYQDLEWIFTVLGQLKITNPELLKSVISTTTKDYVEKVLNFVNQQVLTKKTIRENIDIFDDKKNIISFMETNLSLLQKKKIPANIFTKNQRPLLLSPEQLEKNIEILTSYDLIGQLVTTNNYSFLEQDDLMQKIDFTLELGLEPFLEENLGLLNYDYVIFQRIRILQGLNIEVSKEELEQVLKADRFIVSDEEINKYLKLVSVSRNMLDEMRILPEDITKTKRCYQYHDIYFSKNKVDRNLELYPEDRQCFIKALFTDRKITDQELEHVFKARKI